MVVVLVVSYFIGMKRNSSSGSAMRDVQHKHQAALLYVALFVYSPVSYRVFQTFNCDELDDGEIYLRADYSLSCLTPRHGWYQVYALIMVIVYPIGIPSVFAWLLFSYRNDLAKSDRGIMLHLQPVQGIWAAYKPSRYYYEIVECIRRLAFTSIAAFVPSNSMANVSIALLCALVFVFISSVLSPFNKGVDIALYRWGNGIIVASMYVAFLMKADVGYGKEEALLTFSGVLIAANVFMVIAVMIQIAFLVKALRVEKEPVRQVDVPVRRSVSATARPARLETANGTRGGRRRHVA